MLIVGLLQGALSYPFFDPVLTGERARRQSLERCGWYGGAIVVGMTGKAVQQ
jgi:hypothetical protein